MKVRVLFFGIAREITGLGQDSPELSADATAADLLRLYTARFPRLGGIGASLVMAVNQEFSDPTRLLAENDEVAFLPPVSGGSGPWTQAIEHPNGHFFALTRQAIDPRGIARSLLRGEDGAVVTFEGVTRNNTKGRPTLYLDYECYEPMAIRVMARIGEELAGRCRSTASRWSIVWGASKSAKRAWRLWSRRRTASRPSKPVRRESRG